MPQSLSDFVLHNKVPEPLDGIELPALVDHSMLVPWVPLVTSTVRPLPDGVSEEDAGTSVADCSQVQDAANGASLSNQAQASSAEAVGARGPVKSDSQQGVKLKCESREGSQALTPSGGAA